MLAFFAPVVSGWNWLINTKWARDLAIAAAILAGLLFGYYEWKKNIEKGIRRQEREGQARRDAAEQVEIVTTRLEITQENNNAAAQADEAVAALPTFPSPRELRNRRKDISTIVLGTSADSGGGAEASGLRQPEADESSSGRGRQPRHYPR